MELGAENTWWLFTMMASLFFPPNEQHVAVISNAGWNEKTVTASLPWNVVLADLSLCCQLAKLSVARATICFVSDKIYFPYTFSQPCFGLLPNKTDGAYPHQPLGENPPNSHFFSFVANIQKIHFTLRLNPAELGRWTDIHVYLFWNICSRTDESSCHGTERSIKLFHMLSHTSKMAPASLPLCLPMKGKAAHQTADKNLDKKGIFYSQPSTKKEEKCDIRDRRNLLLFRLWTLNSLSVLMRKQDQRSRWRLSCHFLYK